jgi:hypothetical protein
MRGLKLIPTALTEVVAIANFPRPLRPVGLVAETLQNTTEVSKPPRLADMKSNLHHASHRDDAYRRWEMPYHIDYLFVPMVWLQNLLSFELGDYDSWCGSGLSDQAPLSAEFS